MPSQIVSQLFIIEEVRHSETNANALILIS